MLILKSFFYGQKFKRYINSKFIKVGCLEEELRSKNYTSVFYYNYIIKIIFHKKIGFIGFELYVKKN